MKHGIEATRADLKVGMRAEVELSSGHIARGRITPGLAGIENTLRVDGFNMSLFWPSERNRPVTILTEPDADGREWELGVPGSELRVGDVVRWRALVDRPDNADRIASYNSEGTHTVSIIYPNDGIRIVLSETGVSRFAQHGDLFDRLLAPEPARDTEPAPAPASVLPVALECEPPPRMFAEFDMSKPPSPPPVVHVTQDSPEQATCTKCRQPFGTYRRQAIGSSNPAWCGDCAGSQAAATRTEQTAPQRKPLYTGHHDNDVGGFASPSWEE